MGGGAGWHEDILYARHLPAHAPALRIGEPAAAAPSFGGNAAGGDGAGGAGGRLGLRTGATGGAKGGGERKGAFGGAEGGGGAGGGGASGGGAGGGGPGGGNAAGGGAAPSWVEPELFEFGSWRILRPSALSTTTPAPDTAQGVAVSCAVRAARGSEGSGGAGSGGGGEGGGSDGGGGDGGALATAALAAAPVSAASVSAAPFATALAAASVAGGEGGGGGGGGGDGGGDGGKCGDVAVFECHECATDEWLGGSLVEHAGICGRVPRGEGDCAAGEQGAWAMGAAGTGEGVGSVAGCVRKCQNCASCSYVSFSLQRCAWFAACDVTELKRPDGKESFRTVRVRGSGAAGGPVTGGRRGNTGGGGAGSNTKGGAAALHGAAVAPSPPRCPLLPLTLWARSDSKFTRGSEPRLHPADSGGGEGGGGALAAGGHGGGVNPRSGFTRGSEPRLHPADSGGGEGGGGALAAGGKDDGEGVQGGSTRSARVDGLTRSDSFEPSRQAGAEAQVAASRCAAQVRG